MNPSDTLNTVVDWIFLEIRNPSDSADIIRTITGLLQRDGDIVDANTGDFPQIDSLPNSFYLAVRHRNHLGVMTAQPIVEVNDEVCVDFTNMTDAEAYHFGAYDGLEMATLNGKKALWAGNGFHETRTKYDGSGNDRQKIGADLLQHDLNISSVLNFNLAEGYLFGDINLDGKVKYDGINNDRIWLQNIILNYPINFNGAQLNNFNLMLEQLP